MEQRCLLAADLSGREFVAGEILVQFAPDATTAQRANVRSAVGGQLAESIHTKTMQASGAGPLERLKLGAGVAIEKVIAATRRMPKVQLAEANYIYRPSVVSNDPYYTSNSNLWGMYGSDSPSVVGPVGTTNQYGIDAERAWNDNVTGSSSVIVGIIDEGIQVTHPDLQQNIWVNPFEIAGDGIDNDGNGYRDDIYGWDFVSNDNSVYDAGQDSHGTHVAGTIGGAGGNSTGVVGVNWNVRMISTKFLGVNGGTTANAVKAVDYLTDLKNRHGINLVASNNSWGGGGYSQSLHDAIIRSAKKEILFIAAAGNSTSNNDTTASYPSNYNTAAGTSTQTAASYDSVIAVASITNTGAISSFSSYGATTVDIGAPGSGINSSVPVDSYANYSGTSMATPHVTGAAALYASVQPQGLSAATIKSALLNSATPTTSLSGKTVTGGRLNVYNAIQSATSIRMDKAVYGSSSSISVTVQNGAANFNSSLIETVTAEIRSTTEQTPEVISLIETGANTGLFVGMITTATGAVAADGVLQVSNADQISVYSAGLNKTATATVDTIAPAISAITSTPGSVRVDIKWTSNEPSTTEVIYGTSPADLNTAYINAGLVRNHTALLGGLTPQTVYYYQVISIDAAGNRSASPTASFMTAAAAQILFVDDDQGATYERFFTSALQANNYLFDVWAVTETGATPAASLLALYDVVIWNTGYDFSSTGAGLSGAAEQAAIQSYLDGGGRIFVSGQDILYNGVTADFRTNYLKVAAFTSDVANAGVSETGISGNAVSNGQALSLSRPADYPALYVDALSPAPDAEGTYLHGVTAASYAFSAVNYRGDYAAGGFGMVFSSFPFESISTSAASPNNQATVMKRVIEYLNGTKSAGVSVSSPTPAANTTEAGNAVSFTVVLDTAPTADVVVPVVSGDTTEGTTDKSSLTFTSANWNVPQTIRVIGVDDAMDDGDVVYAVRLDAIISADSAYSGLNPADVSLSNQDDDTAGVTVTAPASPGNQTSENLTNVSFTIRLNSEPTANVTIGLSSTDTTEGTLGNVTSVAFTPANWSVAQTVTVTGVDDSIFDGNIVYSIVTAAAASSDPLYAGRVVADVSLVNMDNEVAPQTKFYVVDDATVDRTYEYTSTGGAVENYPLTGTSNTASRGIATTAAGDRTWVVDRNRNVYIYSNSGGLLGFWTASGTAAVSLTSTSTIEGITTDGTNIWIVDSKSDRVFYYAGAASRLTNNSNNSAVVATGSFLLASGNTGPKDLVYGRDGNGNGFIWVVNDASTDKIFRYLVTPANGSISSSISWNLNTNNKAPTGITLDPGANGGDLWVLNNGTSKQVFVYTNGREVASSTAQVPSSSVVFVMSGLTSPQGIADPPPVPFQSGVPGLAEYSLLGHAVPRRKNADSAFGSEVSVSRLVASSVMGSRGQVGRQDPGDIDSTDRVMMFWECPKPAGGDSRNFSSKSGTSAALSQRRSNNSALSGPLSRPGHGHTADALLQGALELMFPDIDSSGLEATPGGV